MKFLERFRDRCPMHGWGLRMKQSETLGLVECIALVSLAWAGKSLALPPSNFLAFKETFAAPHYLVGHESFWAGLALLGATMLLLGLLTILRRELWDASFYLRVFGCGISVFFWLVMSGGAVWANSDTLFGFLGYPIAGASAWLLARAPAFPEAKE